MMYKRTEYSPFSVHYGDSALSFLKLCSVSLRKKTVIGHRNTRLSLMDAKATIDLGEKEKKIKATSSTYQPSFCRKYLRYNNDLKGKN